MDDYVYPSRYNSVPKSDNRDSDSSNPRNEVRDMLISQRKIKVDSKIDALKIAIIEVSVDGEVSLRCASDKGGTFITYVNKLSLIDLQHLLSIIIDFIPVGYKDNEVKFLYKS